MRKEVVAGSLGTCLCDIRSSSMRNIVGTPYNTVALCSAMLWSVAHASKLGDGSRRVAP